MSHDPLKEAAAALEARAKGRLREAGAAPVLDTRVGTEIPVEAAEWFWDERMPFGEINLIEGDQMMGKTTVALELAARVTRGEPLPFDARPREAGCVMFFSPEEETGKAGLPRFIAAGGDRSRFIEVRRNPHSRAPQMVFPAGASLLDGTLTELAKQGRKVLLLVVDGISVILGDGKSENSNNDVKDALASLLQVTRKHGVALIGLRHLGKGKDTSPIHRGVGSIAFGAMARSQWAVVVHPDNPDRKLLAPLKWSYSKKSPRSAIFELASVDVDLDGGGTRSFGVCRWLDECDVSAREAFDAASKTAKGVANPKHVQEAAAAIEAAFADFEKSLPIEQHVWMPDVELKEIIVKHYKIPAAAYFAAKKLLSDARKLKAARKDGAWGIERARSQWARSAAVQEGEGE